MARALGCRVIAFKRTPEKETECVDLDTLCRESDIISVHLPLNETTNGIISAERIALMKKQVIFVNLARGAVTDEKALADALSNNRIGGLGVDVYSREPFGEDHPFYPMDTPPSPHLRHIHICYCPERTHLRSFCMFQ